MANYYLINGYWKDDKSEFKNYLVKDTHDVIEKEDDSIFWYGLSEKGIQEAIKVGEDTTLEFVITSYKRNK